MTVDPRIALRLQFLARVVRKECWHLATTDQRLFASAFTLAQANQLEADSDLAERVEPFVGRFGRLQDTGGDQGDSSIAIPDQINTLQNTQPTKTAGHPVANIFKQ